MENLQKIFIIFLILSLLFLVAGVVSADNLADIEWSRTQLISNNPRDIDFHVDFNSTVYVPQLSFSIKNDGRFDFSVERVTWVVYLVNGSRVYQANNYGVYFEHGHFVVPARGVREMSISDNKTSHTWMGYVLKNLNWMVKKYGKSNITWKYTLNIQGEIGDFQGEEYKYNYRTWYLWKLSEVEISNEGYSGET